MNGGTREKRLILAALLAVLQPESQLREDRGSRNNLSAEPCHIPVRTETGRVDASRPHYAVVIIIHEELHSLGLGENPPSSEEITYQVISRCAK